MSIWMMNCLVVQNISECFRVCVDCRFRGTKRPFIVCKAQNKETATLLDWKKREVLSTESFPQQVLIKPLGTAKYSNQICNLTPWDIAMMSMHYIQTGLLFKKPDPLVNHQNFMKNLLDNLKHSLSLALFHFYPLAGHLVTQKTKDPSFYTIFVNCKNPSGARFVHATCDMTISDILSPVDVPSSVVRSFFDLNNAVNHDGHTMPLLSIKVTELVDGVFIGCSMNHALGDGTSFWHFFNTWSEIFQAQAGGQAQVHCVPISCHPIHNRWFLDGCSPSINLPFEHEDEFISRFEAPKLRERIFHFSAESIAKLKARANWESNTTKISSFQSLSAHVWRCITRARHMPYDERTSCKLAINNRPRMEPPLANEYFGNAINVVSTAGATAGELLKNDLGWAAWKVHMTVANHNDEAVRHKLKEWLHRPVVFQLGVHLDPSSVTMSCSPRFNVYGNEFGMGKAVAVLSGSANKVDGNVRSYPGNQGGGSVDLEVSLLPDAMAALESDDDFMEAVSAANRLC